MEDPPYILVIDDDEASARLLEVAFRRMNVRVAKHGRGYGALQQIATLRPIAVILDVSLPGLDGPSLLELIRQDAELKRTRVILWSALPPDELRQTAEARGADAWMEKTVGVRLLVERVRDLLFEWDGTRIEHT